MDARTWRHSTRGATAGSKARLAQVLSVNTKMRLCPQPTQVWSNVLKTRGVWLGRRREARKATGRRKASTGQKQSKPRSHPKCVLHRHTAHADLMVWNKEPGGREGKKLHVLDVGPGRYDHQGYPEEKP